MPRKPTGNPNGRPKIAVKVKEGLSEREIDLDQVIYWIGLQASCQEIAASFRVSSDTLVRRIKENFGMTFAELRERTDGQAKLSLRRFQFKLAEKNASMAIWLGKQWLGQRDNERIEDQQSKRAFEEFNRIMTGLSDGSNSDTRVVPLEA
jgi:AraC-like DNA-binding protein